MMQNNLDPRDGLTPRAPQAESTDQELAPTGRMADAVHAWLDGEPVTDVALSAAPREVAFWNKVNAETSARRQVATPSHLAAQILAKLDDVR